MKRLKSNEDGLINIQKFDESFPNSDILPKIVAVLQDVYRVDEAKSVIFITTSGALWLTAFMIWCLGISLEIQDP